jgi:hypothetical protein
MRATGQNGSSRHMLALFDSSSKRINEQSSGLLIRGFGVQVLGGAPVLTWSFTALGHFSRPFVPMPARESEAQLAAGMPPYLADGLAELFAERRAGRESAVSPLTTALPGRPAMSFAEFAARNVAVFRGEVAG